MSAALVTPETNIVDLPYGVHPRLPGSIYHARIRGLVSKSALDLVARAPALYKAWLDGAPEVASDALDFGSAFHTALLEPHVFAALHTVEPNFGDCRFKENKAKRDEWRAANAGKKHLSKDDDTRIRGMVRAIREHRLASRILAEGEPELTVKWKDETTGLTCKARADYYVKKHRMIADVKSTSSASYGAFRRSAAEYRYHVQDALYRSGFRAAGEPVDTFVFVAVEKDPPHLIATYVLDDDDLARGAARARADMATLHECLMKDEWPGYPVEIQTLKLPSWAA